MDGLRPRGRQLPSSTEPLSDGSQGLLLRRARRRPASSRRENHRQGRRRWGVRTRIPDLPTQIGPPRSSTRCRSPRWRPKGGGPTHRGPGMGCRWGHLPVGRTQHRPHSSSVHWREQKGYAESVTGHTRLAVVNQCRCVSRRQQRLTSQLGQVAPAVRFDRPDLNSSAYHPRCPTGRRRPRPPLACGGRPCPHGCPRRRSPCPNTGGRG